jgi:putative endonuclease
MGEEDASMATGTNQSPKLPPPGAQAEALALAHLQRQGLVLLSRNYRIALGPRRRGGEIDLVMQDRDGSLVFVEVRSRASTRQGGAAASVGARKRASLVLAARHFLVQRGGEMPPCRFDVVAIDGGRLEWLRAAFDASS